MKPFVLKFFLALSVGLLSVASFAQNKTQSYYNTHESEILPDARTAFQRGNYERAVELCKWHYIIVGTQDAAQLRDRAERCVQLSAEMAVLQAAGKMDEAKEVANAILAINSKDPAAQKLLEELAKPKPIPQEVIPVDTVTVVEPPVEDLEIEAEVPVQQDEQEELPVEEKPEVEPIVPTIPVEPIKTTHQFDDNNRAKFYLKAGASSVNPGQFGDFLVLGGSVGYVIAGSRLGFELGGYFCPASLESFTLFGADASLVIRASNKLYPKALIGVFSYNPYNTEFFVHSTVGLCAGAGLTYLVGKHFCIEGGIKYYPEVKTRAGENVTTTPGVSYVFPTTVQVIPGGVTPFISIGWMF